MAKANSKSIGAVLIQIALAVVFIVAGIGLLGDKGFFATSELRAAIYDLFGKDLRKIVAVIIGVVLILCGAFLIVKMFADKLTGFDKGLFLATLIIWIVVTVLVDFVHGIDLSSAAWYGQLARDFLIIGGLLTIKD